MHKKILQKNQNLLIDIQDSPERSQSVQQKQNFHNNQFSKEIYQRQDESQFNSSEEDEQIDCAQDNIQESDGYNQDQDQISVQNERSYQTEIQQYLIVQHSNKKQKHEQNKQLRIQARRKSFNKNLVQPQKDLQVERIIQVVLLRRKQKQIKQRLLKDILNSQTKTESNQKLYQNYIKQKQSSSVGPNLIFNQNTNNSNQSVLKSNYDFMIKCKDLQTKIKIMARKKQIHERERIIKQKDQKKGQEKCKNKTKLQLSVQKLKDRLQKVLQLNKKLSRRVKLEKSKLTSICISNNYTANSKDNFASINQESTINNVDNCSKLNNADNNSKLNNVSKKGIQNTFRQTSSGGYISFRVARSPSIVSKSRKIVQKQDQNEKMCKKCKNCVSKGKKLDKKQGKIPINSNYAQKWSPSKYCSPILFYNSYLIDQVQKCQQNVQKQSQRNIYIEDDMQGQGKENQTSQMRKSQSSLFKYQQSLREIQSSIQQYSLLDRQEISLLSLVEMNTFKIKEHENKHYSKAIQSNESQFIL